MYLEKTIPQLDIDSSFFQENPQVKRTQSNGIKDDDIHSAQESEVG